MIEVGRVCLKIAGRDADRKCVILKMLDSNFVLIDGQTRRKRCNIIHLEPLAERLDLKEDAPHETVKEAFKTLGIELVDAKSRPKKEKPKAQRKAATKVKEPQEEKPKKVKKASGEKPAVKHKKKPAPHNNEVTPPEGG